MAAEFTVVNGLLMRGYRIVIPSSMRSEMLEKLHRGHQGFTKCRERARQSIWWPGLSKQLVELVKNCKECCRHQAQRAEPLVHSVLPLLPWQKVAVDLFEWRKHTYLLLIDYYSRYIEIAKLGSLAACEVIIHLKSIFARHGIPEQIISDNGPQFASMEFAKFKQDYGFDHLTSSPRFPQSNGEAERAVQTVKNLLEKEDDPYVALLVYRTTPLQIGFSPAELLMSRKLRTTIPTTRESRKPQIPNEKIIRERDENSKKQQKCNFDTNHGVRPLTSDEPRNQSMDCRQRL